MRNPPSPLALLVAGLAFLLLFYALAVLPALLFSPEVLP